MPDVEPGGKALARIRFLAIHIYTQRLVPLQSVSPVTAFLRAKVLIAMIVGLTGIVIVTSYRLFGECLVAAFQKRKSFTAFSMDFEQRGLFRYLDTCQESVVLLDSRSMEEELASFIKTVLKAFANVKVLILGTVGSDPLVVDYLEAGAKGYAAEDISVAELESSIHKVCLDEVVCTQKAIPFVFKRLADVCNQNWRKSHLDPHPLTFREQQILELMAQGLTNEQIGAQLDVSAHTAKNHVHNILKKLRVDKRLQAVQAAYKKKWLKTVF